MDTKRRNISEIRNDYKLKQLDKKHVSENPSKQLEAWLSEAIDAALYEPTAMTLSTVSKDGKPSSRVLLLKGVDERGLIYYTNYKSKKGKELNNNPFTAINFFWPELERQVRVEGRTKKISQQESEEYFQSRPRGSQLGALTSSQSEEIEGREKLEKVKEKLEKDFSGKIIPKPDHWGGYVLIPDYFEFWQGRPDRLHDRIVYFKEGSEWKIKRLAP
jgi:pyridoxamine 5'-phosphate oxidase